MNEPTMKEIAEWLREAANLFILEADYVAVERFNDRAAQVEAMGERPPNRDSYFGNSRNGLEYIYRTR